MSAQKVIKLWCIRCAVGTFVCIAMICAAIAAGFIFQKSLAPDEGEDPWADYEGEDANFTTAGTNGTRLLHEAKDPALGADALLPGFA